jgi:hypothetical protein
VNTVERPVVRWFGKPPTPEQRQAIEERDLKLFFDEPDTPELRFARCAVFWATDEHYGAMVSLLEDDLAAAVDEGLLVYVVVPDRNSNIQHTTRAIEKIAPNYSDRQLPVLVRAEGVSIHEIANGALLHKPGPLANGLLKVPDGHGLSPTDLRLLQRAFHDFSEVRLTPISAGFSGADTFFVESVRLSPVRAEPKPYFLKVGDSEDLVDELERFRKHAEHFITWTLRPNFVPERSIQGTKRGLLVGAFVEGAESLAHYARKGEGVPYITALFEDTMAGLRKHCETKVGSVVDALHDYDKHDRIPAERVEAARALGGQVYEPKQLWRGLLSAPTHSWNECVMHGDMHGQNVRARRGEAILIDFAHTTRGPTSADPACLEVWLVMEPDGHATSRDQWRAWAEELYRPDVIEQMLTVHASPSGYWFHDCVAEIRRVAAKSLAGSAEYKLALTVFLLRHASFTANEENKDEDEYRRTYAYWLANRLVTTLAPQTFQAAGIIK